MAEDLEAPEGLQRILSGLGSHLEDPKVVSAVLLSAVAYTRANDINSAIHRWMAYIKGQQGVDVGVSNFWKAVSFFTAGVSGFGLAEGVDRLLIEQEIKRLEDEYAAALKEYHLQKPAWDANQAGEGIPEPQLPVLLTFIEWSGSVNLDEVTPEQKQAFFTGWLRYNAEYQVRLEVYNRTHRRWLEIQNMDEPILPIPDPAIDAWRKAGVVSQEDAAAIALIAFIIGLNPSIVPEALKGVGEIVKGIGEIVPL